MLLHKKARIIERVGSRGSQVVIDDGQGGDTGTDEHRAARGIAKREHQSLVAFDVTVVDDQHDQTLAGLAWAKLDGTRADGVIGALLSGEVAGSIIYGDCA